MNHWAVFTMNGSSVNKPVRVQAGRVQAGSAEKAGSCWCSPASEAPGRRAGSPNPGWPGCHSRGLHAGLLLHFLHCGFPCCLGFFDAHLESRLLLHCLPCLSFLHHDLEEKDVCYTRFIAALTEHVQLHTKYYSTVVCLCHLQRVRWPAPCTQVEVWGASQGWRGWGCSGKSEDRDLCRSYQSGRGSGNTYWTNVL